MIYQFSINQIHSAQTVTEGMSYCRSEAVLRITAIDKPLCATFRPVICIDSADKTHCTFDTDRKSVLHSHADKFLLISLLNYNNKLERLMGSLKQKN